MRNINFKKNFHAEKYIVFKVFYFYFSLPFLSLFFFFHNNWLMLIYSTDKHKMLKRESEARDTYFLFTNGIIGYSLIICNNIFQVMFLCLTILHIFSTFLRFKQSVSIIWQIYTKQNEMAD